MSVKDCIALRKKLDPVDRETFDAEFDQLTKGGIPTEAAYSEAAEAVMESILAERNGLADEISSKGGYLEKITLENLVNPASYKPELRGDAADIAKISVSDFDALLEDVAPPPAVDVPVPAADRAPDPVPVPAKKELTEDDVEQWFKKSKKWHREHRHTVKDYRRLAKAAGIPRYSSMSKSDIGSALRAWYDARVIDRLPEPSAKAADSLRAGTY